jgi:DNA-binding NarL/FixJ family response regulator
MNEIFRMIVYFCSDLFFATRVRSTSELLSVTARPVRDAAMLQARLDQVDDGRANEPVDALLVDLDTGEAGLAMIQQAKQHDPQVQVIAFGSHVAKDLLAAARDRGADQVMPRSAFTAQLPDLLKASS